VAVDATPLSSDILNGAWKVAGAIFCLQCVQLSSKFCTHIHRGLSSVDLKPSSGFVVSLAVVAP